MEADLSSPRIITGIFALALGLAGCGGPGPTTGAQFVPAALARAHGSWIEPSAKSSDLLYVSDLGTNLVDVFTYPAGTLVGKLSGFGSVESLCADKAGDVFVVDEAGPVQMFAHGGTAPVRKLTTTGAPDGCAVDPVTGNLAVTNLSSVLYGAIDIYPKAKGNPIKYNNTEINSTYFCGYDGKGNLYADGNNRSAQYIFMQLPKGKSAFTIERINVKKPGGVQWDGTYVAVGDETAGVVYRMTPGGMPKQTVTLKQGANLQQFWLQNGTLIGPIFQGAGPLSYWRYPAGGSPTKTISGLSEPIGATVSVAK